MTKTAEQIISVTFTEEELRHVHCSAYIDRGGGIGTDCTNKPKWKFRDKLYCTLHRPDRVRARDEARREGEKKSHEEWEVQQKVDAERVCAKCRKQIRQQVIEEIEKKSFVYRIGIKTLRKMDESWWQQFRGGK